MEQTQRKREKSVNGWQVATLYGGLFVFGVVYDRLIAALEENAAHDSEVSLAVVVGTLVTLAGVWPLLGIRRLMVVLLAFGASGGPMILGSKRRYWMRREKEKGYVRYGECGRDGRAAPQPEGRSVTAIRL